jgi:hypothetical protein
MCLAGWADTSGGDRWNTEADTEDHYLGRSTGRHNSLITQVEERHNGVI